MDAVFIGVLCWTIFGGAVGALVVGKQMDKMPWRDPRFWVCLVFSGPLLWAAAAGIVLADWEWRHKG